MKCLIKESKQWLQGNSESREYRKFREIKKNEKLLEEIKLIKQYQMKYCNEEFLSHKKKKNWKPQQQAVFIRKNTLWTGKHFWRDARRQNRGKNENSQLLELAIRQEMNKFMGFRVQGGKKKGKSIEKPVQWNNCWKTPWFGSMWTSRYRRPVGPLIDQNRSWSWHIIVKLWNVQDREERQTDRRERRKKDLKCCNRRALLWSWYCGTER